MINERELEGDIPRDEIACWLAIRFENLKDIRPNSVLAIKVNEAAQTQHSELRDIYVTAAKECRDEGIIEVDDNAAISLDNTVTLGNEEGAYVQAWIWVSKEGLPGSAKAADMKRRRWFVTDTLFPSPEETFFSGKKGRTNDQ